jgi:hypothetical protein
MKILTNAFWTIDTILAGGAVVAEVHNACYVYKQEVKVDIKVYVKIKSQKFDYDCSYQVGNKVLFRSDDIEKFCGYIEASGFQLGCHDKDLHTLTDLGEQEVALLSSIPYLFREKSEIG